MCIKYKSCVKKYKLSFLYDTKKLISFFLHYNFFIFSFYITQFHHVDLLCSGPGEKETFNPSFTHLSDIPKQLLSKSCSWKKVSYYLGLMFVKRLRGAHILVKLQACFSQDFAKINPVTRLFQGFYLGFKQFSIVCNISRRLSNGRFRKF